MYSTVMDYLFIDFSISHYTGVLLDAESLQCCVAKFGHELWKYKEKNYGIQYISLNIEQPQEDLATTVYSNRTNYLSHQFIPMAT